MDLSSLVMHDILGDSDEEALETVRTMRLARVQGATIVRQKTERSMSKTKTSSAKKKPSLNTMTDEQKLELLRLLEGE